MAKRYLLQAHDLVGGAMHVWVSTIPTDEEFPGSVAVLPLTILATFDTGTRARDSIEDPFRGVVTGGWFYGEVVWRVLGVGTPVFAGISSELYHDGIMRLTTSATGNDYTALVPGLAPATSTPIIGQNAIEEFEWIVRIPTVTSIAVNVGLMQDIGAANGGTDAIMFTADTAVGTTWRCNARQAGTTVTADTGLTFAAGNWVQLGAKRNGTKWDYYANDDYLFSLAGTPAVSHTYGARLLTRSAAVRTLDLDHFSMGAKIQRYT